MKTLFALLLTFTTLLSCNGQEQTSIIKTTCLSEIISSNDEIECFAFYFDIKPDSIKANLNHYRVLYSSELRDAGYNPTNPFTLIKFKAAFNNYGNLISWEQYKKLHCIDKDNQEHRVYNYPLED